MTNSTTTQRLLIPAVSFAWLLAPALIPNASAQYWMTPAYSSYSSYTTDGTYIYTSVTVDGSTNGSCPTQPAYLANECHSTTHTPKVYNVVGGVGGWESGGAVYWSNYLSLTNNQQIAATPGTEYTFSGTGEVICSFIGSAIYQNGSGNVYLSLAFTTVQTVSDDGGGTCTTQPDCTGGVTPRCNVSPVIDGVPCAPGFFCASIAYRFSLSSPFSCTPAGCIDTVNLPGQCTQ